jgi:hypothetical protein
VIGEASSFVEAAHACLERITKQQTAAGAAAGASAATPAAE